jgi:hypothetical protein
MCSNIGYNQFHKIFFCEAGPGSVNGDGEDLQQYTTQTAAECVAKCEIDYSNRIGHMCNSLYYGYFHRPWYCEVRPVHIGIPSVCRFFAITMP